MSVTIELKSQKIKNIYFFDICLEEFDLVTCRPHFISIQTHGNKFYPSVGQPSIIGNPLLVV